jgi:hypothetical protein
MKGITGFSLSLLAVPLLLPLAAQAQSAVASAALAAPAACEGPVGHMKSVALPGPAATNVNYAGTNGQLEPVPLLSTSITVPGGNGLFARPSCLQAQLSAMAAPIDNWVVFQVRVDGVPMIGHPASGPNTIPVPVVSTPDDANHTYPYERPVSYTFYSEVSPGTHTVDVLWGTCCSANTGGTPVYEVFAATLNLLYK